MDMGHSRWTYCSTPSACCALTTLVPRLNLSPDDTFVQSHAEEKPFNIAGVVYKNVSRNAEVSNYCTTLLCVQTIDSLADDPIVMCGHRAMS